MTSDTSDDPRAVREALQNLPALAATAPGQPPKPEEIFFPREHARALDPETSLVVGNRGMGKSFWANALAQPDTRQRVASAYQRELAGVEARFVFASAEGVDESVSRDAIEAVPAGVPADAIWRAAILPFLSADAELPATLRDRVDWVGSRPEEQRELLRAADRRLAERGARLVLLFDALDQLAGSWSAIQHLTQGLLELALRMQSYRNIRLKIFMRPDQFESPDLFRFPDASKIKTGSVRLNWRAIDLFGLLFFELSRRARDAFERLCARAEINLQKRHPLLGLPSDLLDDPLVQKNLFHEITGPYMGKNAKRGLPYTWLPVHLADAKGEVAPRTFLRALRQAAHHAPAPTDRAIDHLGIQQGVREASEQRLRELEEDYPWVSAALEPLRGLQVPAEVARVHEVWEQHGAIHRIVEQFRDAKGPIGLELMPDLPMRDALALLQKNLEAIGVMEVRANGKIDVPDIFRIKAGILRKGGVTPQRRQRL